jgi:putative FmdB family regulatory protein
MPIYEYRCDNCGHELEKLQRMSDSPLRDCPACGNPSLRRLVSAAGFRLKGSGWYETDFKQDNRRNLAGDGKQPDGSGSEGSAGKKDEKGATGGKESGAGAAGSESKGGSPKTDGAKAAGGGKSASSKPGGSGGTAASA